MNKKMLGLLPLVWLAVLAQHLTHPAHSLSTAGYGGGGTILHTQYGVFYKTHPHVVPVYLSLCGRSIESVTLDGSATQPSHAVRGRLVEFCCIPHTTSFQSSTVLLTPSSLLGLPTGPQRIRFTMTDHSFVDYYLMISGDRQPSSPSVSLKDIQSAERHSAEIGDRQDAIRVADGRSTATL